MASTSSATTRTGPAPDISTQAAAIITRQDAATLHRLAEHLKAGGRPALRRALGARSDDGYAAASAVEGEEIGEDLLFGELRRLVVTNTMSDTRNAGAAADVTEAELFGLVQAALADHDAIMAADFRMDPCGATTTADDWQGLLALDPEDPGLTADQRKLFAALEACPYCRWSARLAWLRDLPRERRTPLEELERLIVEPAVVWRELEVAWMQETATAYAATATAAPPNLPTILCLDGRTGERVQPERIDEPKWRGAPAAVEHSSSSGSGNSNSQRVAAGGRLCLSLFGLPARYSRYRLVLLGQSHLSALLPATPWADARMNPATEMALPSLDEIERYAPDLLAALTAAHGLPQVVLPQFTGRLTPYGEHSTLTWQSPPIAPVRLRAGDVVLCCLY